MSSDNYPYIYTIFQPFQENFKGFNKKHVKKLSAAAKKKAEDKAKKAAAASAAAAAAATATTSAAAAAQERELRKAEREARLKTEKLERQAAAAAAAGQEMEIRKAEREARFKTERLAKQRRKLAHEEKLRTWVDSEKSKWESSQIEIEKGWNAKQAQLHNQWTKVEQARRDAENAKWNQEEERKDKKITEYDEMIDEKKVQFEANESSYKNALDEISAETDAKRAEWNTFKSAYCPSQGTFDLNDLKNSFGPNYPDVNRYAIIKSETKSTYDLLKRSEICTTLDNSELIKKYNDKVNNEEEILKDEHSELLRFFEKNVYNLSKREIEEKENKEKSGTNIHSTGDNINKRKSFYQGILSHERLGYIRLVEIIYIVVWVLMAISLLLKPEISMIKKFIYIILFLILPYFVFNFAIYYLNSIRNYFSKNFNVYDNVYNHVK